MYILLIICGLTVLWLGWNRYRKLPKGDPQIYEVILTPDASGSMRGKKNEDSKKAQHAFLDELPLEQCRIGVVTFSGSKAQLIKPLGPDSESAREAIDRIIAGGSTPFFDGLQKSYHQISEKSPFKLAKRVFGKVSPNSDSSRVIVLSSDGHHTSGPGKSQILKLGTKIKREGIRIVTIAIGKHADQALLKKLASTPDDFHQAQYSDQLKDVYKKVASDLVPING